MKLVFLGSSVNETVLKRVNTTLYSYFKIAGKEIPLLPTYTTKKIGVNRMEMTLFLVGNAKELVFDELMMQYIVYLAGIPCGVQIQIGSKSFSCFGGFKALCCVKG